MGGGGTLELAGLISGAGGLNKIDPGTLILSSIGNAYTGITTINAGALAGIGKVGGELVVNSGGSISPGSTGGGSFGQLLVGSNVTFAYGSTLNIEIGTDTSQIGNTGSCDSLAMGGALTLGGTLNVTKNGFVYPGSYTIISGATSRTGQFTKVKLPQGRTYTVAYPLPKNGLYSVVLNVR